MRIVFTGLDEPLELPVGECVTLEVENQTLFARLALSLRSLEGRFAAEPYSLWEDDEELKPSEVLLVIDNPLSLPWDERALMARVIKRLELEFLEDEDLRQVVEGLQMAMNAKLMSLGLGMNADYAFANGWEFKKYLKFVGFGVDYQETRPILDNLLNFLSLTLDASDHRVLVFVNLKTFLSKSDFKGLLEQVFYQKSRVLLIENKRDDYNYDHEYKRAIDLHFLESWGISPVGFDRP